MDLLNKSKNYKIAYILSLFIIMIFPTFAAAMTVSVDIPEKYSEITAGEKVYFETDVKWPENVGRKDLRIEYSVKDKNGNEVAYLKDLKAIETQASFMDSISIPVSTAPGMYIISMKISDYQNLNQEVSASFKVVKASNSTESYLLIIIGILGVIVVFVLIELFILMKKKNNY
jgi:uncharacterized membrane protein